MLYKELTEWCDSLNLITNRDWGWVWSEKSIRFYGGNQLKYFTSCRIDDSNYEYHNIITLFFKREEDLTLFKLTWG